MKKSNLAFVILGLGPAFLFYAFLFVYPSISAFRISLFDWSGFTPDMQFIGLANFIELFQDRHFWTVVMRNSFFIILFAGIGVFGLSLLFSNALTSKIKGKRFLRSAIFFPNVVNPIALAVLWSFIYNRQWGLLNSIIGVFGFEAQTWTSTDRLFWALLVALIYDCCDSGGVNAGQGILLLLFMGWGLWNASRRSTEFGSLHVCDRIW